MYLKILHSFSESLAGGGDPTPIPKRQNLRKIFSFNDPFEQDGSMIGACQKHGLGAVGIEHHVKGSTSMLFTVYFCYVLQYSWQLHLQTWPCFLPK